MTPCTTWSPASATISFAAFYPLDGLDTHGVTVDIDGEVLWLEIRHRVSTVIEHSCIDEHAGHLDALDEWTLRRGQCRTECQQRKRDDARSPDCPHIT